MNLRARIERLARQQPKHPVVWVRPRIVLPDTPDDYLIPIDPTKKRISIPDLDDRLEDEQLGDYA